MRRKQYFLLGCGVFPESLTTKISVAAAECAVFLVDKKIPPIITDLPLYGVPVENWIFPPQRSISRDYWQWFDRDEAYFDSLLRPGDEVHAFAYVRIIFCPAGRGSAGAAVHSGPPPFPHLATSSKNKHYILCFSSCGFPTNGVYFPYFTTR